MTMNLTASEWLNEYDRAQSLVLQAKTMGRGAPSSQMGEASRLLEVLTYTMRQMEQRPVDFSLTQTELSRRRILLQRLRGSFQEISPNSSGGGEASSAASRMESGGGGARGGSGRLISQKEQMREQDRMLSALGQGVGRLHQQTMMINEEANLHVRLLGDMDLDVDKASTGLRQEAMHAQTLRKKNKTFCLYVIIFALLAVLILLLILGV